MTDLNLMTDDEIADYQNFLDDEEEHDTAHEDIEQDAELEVAMSNFEYGNRSY